MQAHEVESRLVVDDAASVSGLKRTVHRQVDPIEAGLESSAPDDVRHVQDPAVLEERLASPHPDGLRDTLHAGSIHVFGHDPNQRASSPQDLRTNPPTHRRAHGQHAMEEHAQHQTDHAQSTRRPGDPEREMAGVPARHPNSVAPRQLHGDLGAGVAGTHEKDGTLAELTRVPVLAGVQLDHAGVQFRREGRNVGLLIARHRDHHVVGLEPMRTRGRDETPPAPEEPVHAHPRPDREPEVRGVPLQEIGHLVLGGKGVGGRRKPHSVQPVVTGGREQLQGVPTLAPRIADPSAGIDDHEGKAAALQMVPDGEARLAAADHEGFDALGGWKVAHRGASAGRVVVSAAALRAARRIVESTLASARGAPLRANQPISEVAPVGNSM